MADDEGLPLLLLAAAGVGAVLYLRTRPSGQPLSVSAQQALTEAEGWLASWPGPASTPPPPAWTLPPPAPVSVVPPPPPVPAPVSLPAPTAVVTPGEWVLLSGLFDAYSPAVGPDGQLYLGGWQTSADAETFLAAVAAGVDLASLPGPDKIYATAHGEPPHVAFQKLGFSVNDPVFFGSTMVYTQLANAGQVAGGRGVFERNELGHAFLVNGVWQDLGTALASGAAGGGGRGAWSPALAGGYVYYSSGTDIFTASINYRQPVDATGAPVGPPEELVFPAAAQMTNLDVLYLGAAGWALVGNTLDQHALVYAHAADGVHFTAPVVLLSSPTDTLLSPQFRPRDAGSFDLLFGRNGHTVERVGPFAFTLTLAPPPPQAMGPASWAGGLAGPRGGTHGTG